MYEQQIYEGNKEFKFEDLKLLPPTLTNTIQFIKFKINNLPLLIQSPKCFIKQGIINEKRKTSDLVFSIDEDDNENDLFMKWNESLKLYCQKIIYENKSEWFDKEWANDINDLEDIDNYFRNIIKKYKNLKNYNINVFISSDIKIYDENENQIDIDKIIGEQTNLLCILEYEGIKCNLNNFQIQIKIKQIMVLETEKVFSKCLIKKKNDLGNNKVKNLEIKETFEEESNLSQNIENKLSENINNLRKEVNNDFINLNKSIELEELKIDLKKIDDTVEIKDKTKIIKELYQNAKINAKNARKLALMAYLEQNNIKNTYMLEDIDSDDEDYELNE